MVQKRTNEAMNALIRSKAGRGQQAPAPAPEREIRPGDLEDVMRLMHMDEASARAWLLSDPAPAPAAVAPPQGNAGSGTGEPPPRAESLAEAMNRAIRIVTGRYSEAKAAEDHIKRGS